MGLHCRGVIRAESEDAAVAAAIAVAVAQTAAHAQNVHGLTEISDEVVAKCAQPYVTDSDIIETNPLS